MRETGKSRQLLSRGFFITLSDSLIASFFGVAGQLRELSVDWHHSQKPPLNCAASVA